MPVESSIWVFILDGDIWDSFERKQNNFRRKMCGSFHCYFSRMKPTVVAVSCDLTHRFRPFEQRFLPWSSISSEYSNHEKLRAINKVMFFSSLLLTEKTH